MWLTEMVELSWLVKAFMLISSEVQFQIREEFLNQLRNADVDSARKGSFLFGLFFLMKFT